MTRARKKLYSIKTGFRLVRNTGQKATCEEKFDDLLLYLWAYCPSGVLLYFQRWLSAALKEEGLNVHPDIIDSAMSRCFKRFERDRNQTRKRRKR